MSSGAWRPSVTSSNFSSDSRVGALCNPSGVRHLTYLPTSPRPRPHSFVLFFATMQAGPRAPGSTQPPVKIYNAVYSSVQVLIHLCGVTNSFLTRSRRRVGLRMYGPGHRRYAQTKRFLRQRDTNPQGCRGRQRTKN